MQEAHDFFVKHGGKAVVLARFVPIVRTFLPFVAGGADMPYRTFVVYNVTGAVAWVGICAGAGYLFGNIPVVKENFELVVLGIVAVSVLPIVVEFVRCAARDRGLATAARRLGVDRRPHDLADTAAPARASCRGSDRGGRRHHWRVDDAAARRRAAS